MTCDDYEVESKVVALEKLAQIQDIASALKDRKGKKK